MHVEIDSSTEKRIKSLIKILGDKYRPLDSEPYTEENIVHVAVLTLLHLHLKEEWEKEKTNS